MFFFIIIKHLNWEILTKNLGFTEKSVWGLGSGEWGSQKKKQYMRGNWLKMGGGGGAWTLYTFKGGGA